MSRTATRQDRDFGPFDDDYRGFEPGEGEGARGPLILALAIGVILIFGAVIWKTYKQGVRTADGALPVVFADASPYKRAPDDPGGAVAPDIERRVYDQIDGSLRTEPVVLAGADPEGGNVQGGPPIELRPGQEEDIDEVTGNPRAADAQYEQLQNLDDVPDAEGARAGSRPAVASSVLDAPIQEPVRPAASRFAFNSSGNYLVQIAALRSQEGADTAWTQTIADEPDMFRGAEKRVQRADLGAKGVFYRLRVGAFAERAQASEFCDALKARGKTCIVVSG